MRNAIVIGTAVLALAAAQTFAQQNQPPAPRPTQPGSDMPRPGQPGPDMPRTGQPGTGTTRPGGSGTETSRRGQQPAGTQEHADHQFAMDAAHINMAEVMMGNLAKEKGEGAPVKQYGDRLVTDHSKALDELKTIARAKNITLPTAVDAKHKASHDKLASLSGAAFDRAFAQAMVEGHKEALQKARTEAKSGTDPELKAFAQKMTTSVEAHLKIAQGLTAGAVGTSGSQRP